jgi:hypothetical protein
MERKLTLWINKYGNRKGTTYEKVQNQRKSICDSTCIMYGAYYDASQYERCRKGRR